MSGDFQKVYSLSRLPEGEMVCLSVDGRRILLARSAGQVFAADDMCTHEDASLSTGSLKGDCVKCPLHGSRFDLKTGKALDDPAEEALRIYPVRVEGDEILVSLSS